MFDKTYPKIVNLLASWFYDSDCEGFQSDEQVVEAFLRTDSFDEYQATFNELSKLIESKDLPWKRIGDIANRCFVDEETCRKWLSKIRDAIQEKLPS